MSRVLIVDDSDSIRLLVRLTLEMDASFEVVGEARDGLMGVQKADSLEPDLIVMDLSMPVMDGIVATSTISERRPGVAIVAFTSAAEPALLDKAIAAGARRTVDKENLVGLLHALQDLAAEQERERAAVLVPTTSVWEKGRAAAAAAIAWTGSMSRRLGRAEMASALGMGAVAALALVMFMVVLPPEDRIPPNAVGPEAVIAPVSAEPDVGRVQMKARAVDDRPAMTDAGDVDEVAAPTVTLEVASADTDQKVEVVATSSARRHSAGHGGHSHRGPTAHHHASHHQGGKDSRGHKHGGPSHHHGPSVAAKHSSGPPGLAKHGGVPPGQAKKQGGGPPGHTKKPKAPKKHEGGPPGHTKKPKAPKKPKKH